MRNALVFLHLAASISWMGGMGFMHFALRPVAAATLKPPERLPLMAGVMRRFFRIVGGSILVLLLTGGGLIATAAGQGTPPGWQAMAGIGVVMMLVFAWIVAVPYRRLRAAVAASNWPEGGAAMGRIAPLVQVNFALGWVAIAAVLFWR